MYFVKAPFLLKKLYPSGLVWNEASSDTVYLTFDDGPHPEVTPFVLEELKRYNALATFFCIGKNVMQYPDLYQRIIADGHSTGNHTYTHLNGWKTTADNYLDNTVRAAALIRSNLFRPPYGRITRSQAAVLQAQGYRIIMWDVLSGDFDTAISPERCWQNVAGHICPGSVVVFHDSSKAADRLRYALPRTLSLCAERGWKMGSL